jgi:hypothetical protein
MRQYYYLDGSEKLGPFTLEELKAQNIQRSTKIWHHPWPGWKPAWQIPELAEHLRGLPPEVQEANFSQPPKNWLLESILVTILCCMPFGVVGIVYASKVETLFYAGRLEESERASKQAKLFTLIGFFICIALAFFYIVFVVFFSLSIPFMETLDTYDDF